MNFFTSDQHFGHANILLYEKSRVDQNGSPFSNVNAMDEYIIKQWNSVVSSSDTVYCLGDLCYKQSMTKDYLARLNGTKILIVGNHDPFFERMLNNNQLGVTRAREAGYSDIHLYHSMHIDGIGKVQLSHLPYAPANPSQCDDHELRYLDHRPKPQGENLLIHGHVHSQWKCKCQPGSPPMLNVGVEVWGMNPVHESEIVGLFEREIAGLSSTKKRNKR